MNENPSGFSLVELLIAMAISSIVLMLITGFLFSQQRIHVTHTTVIDMHQGARSAISLMTREIRMAGFDPTGIGGTGIEKAEVDAIEFSFRNDAGTIGTIEYALSNGNLGRSSGGDLQPIAYNVDTLDFVYLDASGDRLDDDGDGNVIGSINDIRAIQISVLARSGDTLPALFLGGSGITAYENLQGDDITPADIGGFRRILLHSTAMARNIGL